MQFARAQERALVTCREAAAILTTKAPPAEAAEYRYWVLCPEATSALVAR